MDEVILECVREGSKLRVRIKSRGYHNDANCQFPRDIRVDGRKYSVPSSAITFVERSNLKFFYRINKNYIKILPEDSNVDPVTNTVVNLKIYEDTSETTCIICFTNEKDVVYSTCGHYCSCYDCAVLVKKTQGKCPMCRAHIAAIVKRDQIE